MNRQLRGFTSIELLIVTSITIILISIGLPSFRSMILNAQIRTESQNLYEGLMLAKTEAISRNQRILFTLGVDSSWIVIVESTNAEIKRSLATEGSNQAKITVNPEKSTAITFNSNGRITTNTDSSPTISQLHITANHGENILQNLDERRIDISTGGNLKICKKIKSENIDQHC